MFKSVKNNIGIASAHLLLASVLFTSCGEIASSRGDEGSAEREESSSIDPLDDFGPDGSESSCDDDGVCTVYKQCIQATVAAKNGELHTSDFFRSVFRVSTNPGQPDEYVIVGIVKSTEEIQFYNAQTRRLSGVLRSEDMEFDAYVPYDGLVTKLFRSELWDHLPYRELMHKAFVNEGYLTLMTNSDFAHVVKQLPGTLYESGRTRTIVLPEEADPSIKFNSFEYVDCPKKS